MMSVQSNFSKFIFSNLSQWRTVTNNEKTGVHTFIVTRRKLAGWSKPGRSHTKEEV